jgi:4-carboxymuconolactone decarboxylase
LAEDRYAEGMKARRAVLGDAHVDRAETRKTDFDRDFQRLLIETAWGQVWSRPGLDKKTRSLITLSLLAGLGRLDELELHLRATPNVGVTPDDVKEAMLHVMIYAGVPAANTAIGIAKRIFAEFEAEAKA